MHIWRDGAINHLTVGSGILVTLVSLTVMFGWVTGNENLVTLQPGYPAMVCNTALGFFFGGVALILLAHKHKELAAWAGILVLAIGILTLAEHVFSINLHIDELFIRDMVGTAEFPGRMSVGTSLCFLLSGSVIASQKMGTKSLSLSALQEAFTALCIVMAAAAWADHVLLKNSQQVWSVWKVMSLNTKSMALHTSLGFIILNAALLVNVWKSRKHVVSAFYFTIPLFIVLFGMAFEIHASFSVASYFIYTPLVLCAYWYSGTYAPFFMALLSTFLSAGGALLFSHDFSMQSAGAINICLAILNFWVTAILVYLIKQREVRSLENEKRLQSILDNTVDGLITIDKNGKIESFNKVCVKIFGYEVSEVIGRNVKILMPEPYKQEHDSYLENYHKTGEKKIIGIGREVEGQRKDGTRFPVDLSVSQVDVMGRRIYSGIVRDITDRKQAEEEIMRSNEELERFAYIASHDLQEPLRMVTSFTRLLEEEYAKEMDEQALEYMTFIREASTRMQSMVADLLEYSRVGSEEAGFSEFQCGEQIKVVLENLHESIKETKAKISVGPMPAIYGNPLRFSRLIQNLIANAIKYREKDRSPVIHIDVEDRKNDWLFKISDNGIGIKPEYLQQIFVIFKRLHNKKDYSGTGIGLAICKKIVESFEGQIWAESEYGKGSTFYFTVPKRLEISEGKESERRDKQAS